MGNLQSCFQAGGRTPPAEAHASGDGGATAIPPAVARAAAGGGETAAVGAAGALLLPLGLEVYEEAFELSGFNTDAAMLRDLNHADLDAIQAASHVPILTEHRQRIIAASRAASRGTQQQAPGTPFGFAAATLEAGASRQQPKAPPMASEQPQQQLQSMPQPSAVTTTPVAGPLTVNRAATLAPRLSAQPPPATRRRAASVSASMRWSELPGEIAGLSYAATAPLQQPQQQAAAADPVALPAATTPRALAPAAVPSSPSQPRGYHSLDPGMQQQQNGLSTAGSVADASSAGPAAASPVKGCHVRNNSTPSGHPQDSPAVELPEAVQMLHGRMLARQRAQSSGGSILHGLPGSTPRAPGSELAASQWAPPEPWAGSGPVLQPPRRALSDAGSLYSAGISHSGSSSRPGTARAADVCSIVHLARERAAARQRLPFTPGLQQCSSLAALDSNHQRLGSSCSMRSGPCSRAQSPAAQQHSGLGTANVSPRPEQPVSLGGAAGGDITASAPPSPSPAATIRDGNRAMRMLQEYRSINELDAAVQARVAQISHATGARAVASAAAAGGAAPCAADAAMSVSGDQQQHVVQGTAALRNSVAVRAKHVLAGRDAPAAAADGTVSVGLLGIREALQNSYDLGSKHGALAAAVAASAAGGGKQPDAPRSRMAAGAQCSGSFGGIKRRLVRGSGGDTAAAAAASVDPQNPFLCAPRDVAACQDGSTEDAYINPFL